MTFKVFSTFEEFWTAISGLVKTRNYPTYHPCCKVWVSRSQKVCRDSHTKKITWGSALSSMGFSCANSKDFLLAHMVEHRWGTPIRFNAACSSPLYSVALNKALETSGTPRKPFSTSGAFQLNLQQRSPTSPRSTPGGMCELASSCNNPHHHPQPAPQLLLESESRINNARYSPSNHSIERSIQFL